jgi:SAM-dependent methyltransferase
MADREQLALRSSFDKVPEIYHAVRPGHPPMLFAALFELLPHHPLLLEVGPGTGQATRDLLAHGAAVHAIELGPAMARTLCDVLPDPRLTVTVGDFEEVPTERAVYDCVFAATAYHWIAPAAQLDRPAILLKPDGVLAVLDLIHVDSPTDHGFVDAVQPIYERYDEGRTGPPLPRREDVEPPLAAALHADPRFRVVDVRHDDWDQTYTAAEFRQLMLSYSSTQCMEPRTQGLLDDIERFVEQRFDGHVTRPLVVTLTTARRVWNA